MYILYLYHESTLRYNIASFSEKKMSVKEEVLLNNSVRT